MSKVDSVSRELGIHQLLENTLYEISGGQKQRVAVARAIITSPEILLADEPTGALDSKSSAALLDVFEDINTMGQTILMVTHSTAAAARAKRVLFIKDGILYNQIFRGEKDRASDVPRNLRYPGRSWRGRRIVMFKLTSKLALSNLKQNRKLYYPFALAVILTTMILYSFIALSLTPHLEDSYGGDRRELFLVLQFRRPAGRHHFGGLCQWLRHEKIDPKNWACTVFWEWRRSISSS